MALPLSALSCGAVHLRIGAANSSYQAGRAPNMPLLISYLMLMSRAIIMTNRLTDLSA